MTVTYSTNFLDPVGNGIMTPKRDGDGYYDAQGFNEYNSDVGGGSYHLGVDWNGSNTDGSPKGNGDRGEGIFSVGIGKVIAVESNESDHDTAFGNYVLIEHDLGQTMLISGQLVTKVYSFYAHLDSVAGLIAGDQVGLHERIGTLGNSGDTLNLQTGAYIAHLHFEMTISSGASLDPTANGYDPNGAPPEFFDPTNFIHNLRGVITSTGPRDLVQGTARGEDIYCLGSTTVVWDGDGDDRVYGGGSYDFINATGTNDNDTYDGGAGNDWVSYEYVQHSVVINLINQTAHGILSGRDALVSIEYAIGSGGNDTLIGTGQNDVLEGREGDDLLIGNFGNDQFAGQAGNDTIRGGAGVDQVSYYRDNWGSFGTSLLENGINCDLSLGVIIDTTNGTDQVFGIENVVGSDYNDTIRGAGGANKLEGGYGSDRLAGRDGNDWLDGGEQKDILIGGLGADSFVIEYFGGLASFSDRFVDFQSGVDRIELYSMLFPQVGGSVTADEFIVGKAAADYNDYFIFNDLNGHLYYDSNGSQAGSKNLIAILNAGTAVAFTDFGFF